MYESFPTLRSSVKTPFPRSSASTVGRMSLNVETPPLPSPKLPQLSAVIHSRVGEIKTSRSPQVGFPRRYDPAATATHPGHARRAARSTYPAIADASSLGIR